MARHSNATPREETSDRETAGPGDSESGRSTPKSHITGSADPSQSSSSADQSHGIDASLKRRARLLITNSSIPRQTRSLIRYALEIKDPYLAPVVRRVEGGEMTIDSLYCE